MLNNRITFWSEALHHWASVHDPPLPPPPIESIMREACSWVLPEAAKVNADLIVITSAMGFHPDALIALARAHFPVALVFTESPYNDNEHLYLAALAPYIFTNDFDSVHSLSQVNPNTYYLPTAFDASAHHPHVPMHEEHSDVLFVGTGFPERLAFLNSALEILNSDGQGPMPNVQLYGFFGADLDDSGQDSNLPPLIRSIVHPPITNDETVSRYRSAKIVLNFYRDGYGYSLNPRAYELAACSVFQLAQDGPREAHSLFGNSISYFKTPTDLASSIRMWLRPENATLRYRKAWQSNILVQGHSYQDRAQTLLNYIANSASPSIFISSSQSSSPSPLFGSPLTYGLA